MFPPCDTVGRSVVNDCGVAITVLCLLLAMQCVGLWSVIVAWLELFYVSSLRYRRSGSGQ